MFCFEAAGVGVVRVGREGGVKEGEDCMNCADVADFVATVEGKDCCDCGFG